MIRQRDGELVPTATGWACPVCGRSFAVFYGLPGRRRCIECWITDPGYDRPDSDPYMVRLRHWADAVAAQEETTP